MIVGNTIGQEQFVCQEYTQRPTGSQKIRLGYQERLPGGQASGLRPRDFDQGQLAIGTTIELEHTRDVRIAREIAMDHLAEDPDYYRKLAMIHLDGARLGQEDEPSVFERLIEERAAIGARRAVKPMVVASIALAGLGLLLGGAALVVAMRR